MTRDSHTTALLLCCYAGYCVLLFYYHEYMSLKTE